MAGAVGGADLFPEFFPIPDAVGDGVGIGVSELMREHTHLAAVVGFVSEHVAEHFGADGPRRSPSVAVKFLDAAAAITAFDIHGTLGINGVESFGENVYAAGGAFGQRFAGLLLRATRAMQLCRDFQVWGGEPDPLGTDVVHVGEDSRDAAGLARWLSLPGGWVEMLDEHLIHEVVGGKDLDGGLRE
jgi:hypothetical protein